MFKDGKYKLHKDGHEYEAVITTLSVYDGFYSKTSDVQFVCIPGHFPIPLDSWLLEDFVMIPDDAVEHRLHLTAPSVRQNQSLPRPSVLKAARQVKHNR